LSDALKNLGLREAFEDSADFSGITEMSAGLKISDALQKAFIEVRIFN